MSAEGNQRYHDLFVSIFSPEEIKALDQGQSIVSEVKEVELLTLSPTHTLDNDGRTIWIDAYEGIEYEGTYQKLDVYHVVVDELGQSDREFLCTLNKDDFEETLESLELKIMIEANTAQHDLLRSIHRDGINHMNYFNPKRVRRSFVIKFAKDLMTPINGIHVKSVTEGMSIIPFSFHDIPTYVSEFFDLQLIDNELYPNNKIFTFDDLAKLVERVPNAVMVSPNSVRIESEPYTIDFSPDDLKQLAVRELESLEPYIKRLNEQRSAFFRHLDEITAYEDMQDLQDIR